MAKLMIELDNQEINNLSYPIIVECWDKSMGSLSFKRKYRKEFNEQERQKIRKLYNKFYHWYLVKGTPQKAIFHPNTITLIERAVYFFASN